MAFASDKPLRRHPRRALAQMHLKTVRVFVERARAPIARLRRAWLHMPVCNSRRPRFRSIDPRPDSRDRNKREASCQKAFSSAHNPSGRAHGEADLREPLRCRNQRCGVGWALGGRIAQSGLPVCGSTLARTGAPVFGSDAVPRASALQRSNDIAGRFSQGFEEVGGVPETGAFGGAAIGGAG